MALRFLTAGARKVRPYWLFVVAFLAAAIATSYANPIVLQSLRYIVFDAYQRFSPAPETSDSPVVIVDIDEASIARLGQWPWPRSTMARLTDALGRDGARAIVFDIMFAEPDRTSPEQMLTWMPPEQATGLRSIISGWPTHDGVFAETLARNPTVLGATLQAEPTQDLFPVKAGMAAAGPPPNAFLYGFTSFSGNLPSLTEAAHGVGSINWVPDRDQVIRRVPLLFSQSDAVVPSLVLEALRVSQGASTYMVRSTPSGVNEVRIGDYVIPTDARSSIWIHFRPSERNRYVPAWRVLSGDAAASAINGKIVLIGASASGLMDLRATPLDASIPGVEVHQQALEQILSGRFLTRPDFAPAVELLVALLAVLLLAFASPRLSASTSAALGAAVILAILGVSVAAFVGGGYLFDPVFPAACAFIFSAAASVYLYRQTERQRSEIRRAFNQYLSPGVVKQLAAHPEKLTLGGEVRDLTLLFCDVRNFTGISEGLSAEELTAFINSLLTPLTDIIIENGGTIDKYMGDAIMAFWNAPVDDPNHAQHACTAATAIAAKMTDLNAMWRAEADAANRPFTQVTIGIGVNSGECCVGNLGSMRRFDYSAIGDNVNITSRLEGLTKIYGLPLIVGEDTARRNPELPFLEIDLVRVKGHKAPSRIFTLRSVLDVSEDATWEGLKTEHEAFVAAYRAGAWQVAREHLARIRSREAPSLDALYALYAARIDRLIELAPEAWDGVFAFEEK